jgi:hypothetical protein
MSATPPPFQPQPVAASRGSGTGKACLWIVGIGLLSCVALSIAGYLGFRNVMGQVSPIASCEQTFDAAEDALKDYAADHGGRLPPAATWMDDVQPYYEKRVSDFANAPDFVQALAPAEPGSAWSCKWKEGTTGIAFNLALSEAEIAKVKVPENTPLLFETKTAARNLAMNYDGGPKGDAPAVMGNKRNWVVYFVEGNNEIDIQANFGSKKP